MKNLTRHTMSTASASTGVTYAVDAKLEFLNARVKESLRIHPGILWQLPGRYQKMGSRLPATTFLPAR